MLRFLTAGESHGQALTAILDGFPAGLKLDLKQLNNELQRRQQGYGRGSRQKIESDSAEISGGVRHGITTGAPITVTIRNRDFENWQHVMSSSSVDLNNENVKAELEKKRIARFRPGHADLAGTIKFKQQDIRDVLERSSARETAARVSIGAICEQLLSALNIRLASHVLSVGPVTSTADTDNKSLTELQSDIEKSEMFCSDPEATSRMKEYIKGAWQEGDSVGGIIEVLAEGLPVGLGSYTQWDEKLDGKLAQALMSIQAVKAVEVGDGVDSARRPGSEVHDALYPSGAGEPLPFTRKTNHAGGIEGGMANGSRLKLRAYMKPIPTLRKGLPSLSFPGLEADTAHYERSDVCAVPAASVVAKAMVSFILAREMLQKFGGDHINDLASAVQAYRNYCQSAKPKVDGQKPKPAATPEMELE